MNESKDSQSRKIESSDLSPAHKMGFGDIVNRAVAEFKNNVVVYLGLGLLTTAISLAVSFLASSQQQAEPGTFEALEAGNIIWSLLGGIVLALFSVLTQAAGVSTALKSLREGRTLTFGESLSEGMSKFWALFVVGIVVGIVFILGFIAFIIPGLIFAFWYYFAHIVTIDDPSKGVGQAMKESKELGKGSYGLMFVMFIVFMCLSVPLSFIPILGLVASAALGSVFMIATVVLYLSLKGELKEVEASS